MKQNSAKTIVVSMRYVPVAAFITMFSHIVLLNLGVDCPVCEILTTMCGYYLAYMFSKALGFCMLHRFLIYYALTCMSCIWLRRFPEGEYGIFGNHITEARVVMLIAGCILLVLLLIKKVQSHVNPAP